MSEPGASGEALGFLSRLERWAALDTSIATAALRAGLLAHLRAEQAAAAANGLIHQFAARALEVADTGLLRAARPAEIRESLTQTCVAERDDLEQARAAVATTAATLIAERGAWLATVSDSATVSAAALALQRLAREPHLLVAEGRPRLRGRDLAARLAQAGVPTWLVADAALPMLLSQAAALWLGADAVTDRGAIVAVGGYAAALAAREHSVPTYVLAPRRKFLPAATAALRIEERPAAEIWEAAPAGVRPRNVHAEMVPLELLRGIVVEDAALGPTESAAVARDRPLPADLAAAAPR